MFLLLTDIYSSNGEVFSRLKSNRTVLKILEKGHRSYKGVGTTSGGGGRSLMLLLEVTVLKKCGILLQVMEPQLQNASSEMST